MNKPINNFKKKENTKLIVLLLIITIMYFFPKINSCIDANKYENISSKKIKYIAFYEYIGYKKKGRLITKINNKKELSNFFKFYWKSFYTLTAKTSGGPCYFMEIKTDIDDIILYLEIETAYKFVRISDGDGYYFKSYKLYDFLKIIDKKQKKFHIKYSNTIRNKYSKFTGDSIEYISIYLKGKFDRKNQFITKITNKNKINEFFNNYWNPLITDIYYSPSITNFYDLKIKTNSEEISITIGKDNKNKLIKIYDKKKNNLPILKSYKLYNFFKILEKTEKDLKNGAN